MVIIYSLLLAEFISTLNNLIMYGVVLSNIYEVFMKLGYFITIISGIAVWLVTMLLFHLTALLFDGNASFNSLLRISPYPYIIPAIAVLVAIILLGQISVDEIGNILELQKHKKLQTALSIINWSFIPYYLLLILQVKYLYNISWLKALGAIVIPVFAIWGITQLFTLF